MEDGNEFERLAAVGVAAVHGDGPGNGRRDGRRVRRLKGGCRGCRYPESGGLVCRGMVCRRRGAWAGMYQAGRGPERGGYLDLGVVEVEGGFGIGAVGPGHAGPGGGGGAVSAEQDAGDLVGGLGDDRAQHGVAAGPVEAVAAGAGWWPRSGGGRWWRSRRGGCGRTPPFLRGRRGRVQAG